MLIKVDDRTATAIVLAREQYVANPDALYKESRAEMDRLLLEDANYAALLMSLGGLMVTDKKLQVLRET